MEWYSDTWLMDAEEIGHPAADAFWPNCGFGLNGLFVLIAPGWIILGLKATDNTRSVWRYSRNARAVRGGGEVATLRGRTIDLQVVEKDDFAQWRDLWLDPEFRGQFVPLSRVTPMHVVDKEYLEPRNPGLELTRLFIQKKDGTRIGGITHFMGSQFYNWMEIGYLILPGERGKGYTTEAVQVLTDYLFLSRQIERIQAVTDVGNVPSQKVLLKAGFQREGELRKALWNRGRWTNAYLFSIIREDWGAPRILEN